MYMRVQYHMERSKTLHDYIDLSEYAGVELEHGHNTAGKLDMSNHSNLGHFDPNSNTQNNYRDMQTKINGAIADLRNVASKEWRI